MQDGLVNVVYKQQGLVDTGLKLDNNTIIISVKASEDGTFQNAYYCGTYASDGSGWMLKKQGVNWMVYANGKNIENQKLAFEIKDNVEIIISTHNKSYNIFIDGKKLASFFDTNSVINFYYNGTFSTGACSKYISTNSINVYNRQLTPQEIAHNFQVLNNSPSINGITTTDNTGKSSILSLATDSRHVVMDNGFNQEEAYTGVLKTMAKDFVADAQGKITVSNGLSCGKVLGLTMSGQTAKNVITSPYNSNRNGWNDVGLFDAIVSGSSITQTSTSGNPAKIRLSKESPFVLNNTYYLTACVENATSATKNGHFNIYNSDLTGAIGKTNIILPPNTKTKIGFILTISDAIFSSGVTPIQIGVDRCSTGDKIIFSNIAILDITSNIKPVEYYDNLLTTAIPFGLSSTVASINNNGQSYPIYEPTIQGKTEILRPTDSNLPGLGDGDILDLATRVITFANKTTRQLSESEVKAYFNHRKIILLDKVGDVADSLEMKEDGSGVWNQSIRDTVLVTEGWTRHLVKSNTIGFYCGKYADSKVVGNNVVATTNDVLPDVTYNVYTSDAEGISLNNQGGGLICLSISKAKLATEDVAGLIKWLQANPVTIRYQLATPIVTHIPKPLMPTIPTDKNIILQLTSPVLASELTIVAPVDQISQMKADIKELQSLVNTPSNVQFTTNYIEDEFNKNTKIEKELNI